MPSFPLATNAIAVRSRDTQLVKLTGSSSIGHDDQTLAISIMKLKIFKPHFIFSLARMKVFLKRIIFSLFYMLKMARDK